MRLYIIRHGQTEWNSSYRLQGRTDIPLNESGRELARKTGEALARQGICFERIYSSPLIRARETAELVSENNGQIGMATPIHADLHLQEISFGAMEGERVRDENGVLNVENYIRFFNDPERYIPPEGGESFEALLERTGEFLEMLRREALGFTEANSCDNDAPDKKHSVGNILISTHGAASRALLANITHCSLRDFWCGGVPKNCAVTIVDLEDGVWKIKEQDRLFYD
ncbi:MAG: histidine phosphatase family protein [Lachnospiraceae bacterium]|nr:histidine phosphatase family protein [Lachnospiraceae bacterium]